MYNKAIWKRVFCYKGKHHYKNILQVPLYFKQLHFLIKHGYDIRACWSVDYWFIDVMQKILTNLRNKSHGYPVLSTRNDLEDYLKVVESDEEKWNIILDRMIADLESMSGEKYEDMGFKEEEELIDVAKRDFFKLFDKYFYCLWD